jgi:hypothetical protein
LFLKRFNKPETKLFKVLNGGEDAIRILDIISKNKQEKNRWQKAPIN